MAKTYEADAEEPSRPDVDRLDHIERNRTAWERWAPAHVACTPPDGGPVRDWLIRDHFGTHRFEFPGDDAVEFHLTHGEWVRILNATGFVLENLIEVQPPPNAIARVEFASLKWAHRWPSEDIWVARKA